MCQNACQTKRRVKEIVRCEKIRNCEARQVSSVAAKCCPGPSAGPRDQMGHSCRRQETKSELQKVGVGSKKKPI